ncbi:MAG: protein-tyrosine-phosphatase [Firmicutes bacterium]|nr:protein-tyrosine-phosphatase [Bacillota bacterium]
MTDRRPDYTFADMHCHIIPQVDDGSESMEMSLAMLHIAAEQNIETIILTPHNKGGHRNVSPAGIDRRIGQLEQASKEEGLSLLFYPGNEILYDSTVPDRLNAGQIATMAGSDYVLIEFKPWEEYSYIRDAFRTISYEGYRPILAHCERYECFLKDRDLVEDLVRAGVLIQLNAEDCVPRFSNRKVNRFCHALLAEELVSFIGTDAHKDEGRTPMMLLCYEALSKKLDPDYVRELMRENTLAVTRNEEIGAY